MSWRRLLGTGVLIAVIAAAVGFALEWRRFGSPGPEAIVRVDREISADFATMTSLL